MFALLKVRKKIRKKIRNNIFSSFRIRKSGRIKDEQRTELRHEISESF